MSAGQGQRAGTRGVTGGSGVARARGEASRRRIRPPQHVLAPDLDAATAPRPARPACGRRAGAARCSRPGTEEGRGTHKPTPVRTKPPAKPSPSTEHVSEQLVATAQRPLARGGGARPRRRGSPRGGSEHRAEQIQDALAVAIATRI